MNKLKIVFTLIICWGINCYTYGQVWQYGEKEQYEGWLYFATVENTQELSTEKAKLVIAKFQDGIQIYIEGTKLVGAWCEAGFKFDNDINKYRFGIQSWNQGTFQWHVKHFNLEMTEDHEVLLENFKKHKYVIVRLTCFNGDYKPTTHSVDKQYKFRLTGSSFAINKILSK